MGASAEDQTRTSGLFTPEVPSVDKSQQGEACSACEVKGREKIGAQIDPGAIDMVGPKR